jgi:hypothetical protein
MSWRQIKRKLRKFVSSLSEKDAREQLYLAYLQMERCRQLLDGEDVEPVTMIENGLDSDLELFYMIKKMMKERSDKVSKNDGLHFPKDVIADIERIERIAAAEKKLNKAADRFFRMAADEMQRVLSSGFSFEPVPDIIYEQDHKGNINVTGLTPEERKKLHNFLSSLRKMPQYGDIVEATGVNGNKITGIVISR